jgi:hypothetical protein
LSGQGKYAQAEAEFRDVLRGEENALGGNDPQTLATCYNFALSLKNAGKTSEAKQFAQRAAEGALRILGSDHPDTKNYQQLVQDLSKPTQPGGQ